MCIYMCALQSVRLAHARCKGVGDRRSKKWQKKRLGRWALLSGKCSKNKYGFGYSHPRKMKKKKKEEEEVRRQKRGRIIYA